jgi:hypothetical protein
VTDDEKESWWNLLASYANYRLGTLWFIKETLLKDGISDSERQSAQQTLPALSIQGSKADGLQDTVIMLLGTSKRKDRSFCCAGLMKHDQADRKTFFNIVRPVRVRRADFFHTDNNEPSLERNTHKPILSPQECEELKQLLSAKTGRAAL